MVIFSPNSQYDDVLEVKTRVEVYKKDVAVDNFFICFKVKSVFTSEKHILYLLKRSQGFVVRNENCSDKAKELALHTTGKKKR